MSFIYFEERRLLEYEPCGSCKDRRLGGIYLFHHQAGKNQRARKKVSSN
jgi:hypothetical protein